MSNVIPFRGETVLDLDPDNVLELTKGKLKSFALVGYDIDGKEFFSSTIGDGAITLWLIERMKLRLLQLPS